MKVERYELRLTADPRREEFEGRVRVHLQHDGGPLALHSVELEVLSAKAGGKDLPFRLLPKEQSLQLDEVPAGSTVVEVSYRAKVPPQGLMGLYRTDYGTESALVSQLEPLGARRVFPCVDHPAQKAVIETEVVTPAGYQVLSNMPEVSAQPQGEQVLHLFAPSPRMSTYLFFVGVGHFEERSVQHGTTRIIVACPPGKGDQSAFALEHAPKLLDFFAGYFGIPYPLPKLHLIAVPNTAVGGMENWGAITFRERALLVNPRSSQGTRRTALGVLAHEIAHQWFGDLVTMAWWNDLWLNESFATFMDYQATDHLYPAWEVWSDASAGTSNAQLWDALPHSHPVDVPVEDPDQISAIFDEISYAKGAALLRMVEQYVGAEKFRRGVARYLRQFSHANARGEDLWAALDAEADEAVSPVLKAWVGRPGYPAVRVRQEGARGVLEQHRFSLLAAAKPDARDPPWPLPLLVLADGSERRLRFDTEHAELPVTDPGSLLVNPGRWGYFRVRYDEALFSRLLARRTSLPGRDRWGLLQDTFAFTLAGELSPTSYLALVGSLAEEREYLVLTELLLEARTMLPVLHDRPAFVEAVRRVAEHQVARLGPSPRPGEPERDAILREGFYELRVWSDPAFAAEMASSFPRWREVDPSLRDAVLVGFTRSAGPGAFGKVLAELQASGTDEDKTRLVRALGAFPDAATQERALSYALGGELSPVLGLELLAAAVGTPEAQGVLWQGLQDALPFLLQAFAGSGILPMILQWSVPYVGLGRADEVKKFFEGKDVGDGAAGLQKGLDLLAVYGPLRERFPAGSPGR